MRKSNRFGPLISTTPESMIGPGGAERKSGGLKKGDTILISELAQ
jgi:hypothetical protein